jgi:hypothetical protein
VDNSQDSKRKFGRRAISKLGSGSTFNNAAFEKDFSRSHEITTPVATSWLDAVVKAFTDQL